MRLRDPFAIAEAIYRKHGYVKALRLVLGQGDKALKRDNMHAWAFWHEVAQHARTMYAVGWE